MLIENSMVGGIKTRRGHFRRHRDADGVAHALAEWAGGAFHARRFKKFGMPRRFGMQLPAAFDFLHRQVVAAEMEPGVEEHAAMPCGENEIIATNPARLVRVMFESVAVKDGAHFGAAKRKSEVTGLRGLHRVHAEPARLVRGAGKIFDIQRHAHVYSGLNGMETPFSLVLFARKIDNFISETPMPDESTFPSPCG